MSSLSLLRDKPLNLFSSISFLSSKILFKKELNSKLTNSLYLDDVKAIELKLVIIIFLSKISSIISIKFLIDSSYSFNSEYLLRTI